MRMSDHHTYKKLELVGSSTTSIEDAINNALAEAAKSVELMEWFEVAEMRGHIENGAVGHYQVTLKVGFRITNS
jgi:flavin-binding protein dodecin